MSHQSGCTPASFRHLPSASSFLCSCGACVSFSLKQFTVGVLSQGKGLATIAVVQALSGSVCPCLAVDSFFSLSGACAGFVLGGAVVFFCLHAVPKLLEARWNSRN